MSLNFSATLSLLGSFLLYATLTDRQIDKNLRFAQVSQSELSASAEILHENQIPVKQFLHATRLACGYDVVEELPL